MPATPNRVAAVPVAALFLMLAMAGLGAGNFATAQTLPFEAIQVAGHTHTDGVLNKNLCTGCRKGSR